MSFRVIKLGGSLLHDRSWHANFSSWLGAQASAHNVVIVGGGELVDQLRRSPKWKSADQAVMHWRAVRAMSVGGAIQADIFKLGVLCESYLELLLRAELPTTTVFDVTDFLTYFERNISGARLPEDWTVTSDSIAARLAVALDAAELVLLKSAPPPVGSIEDLAASGYVDEFLPSVAIQVQRIRCVCLRGIARSERIYSGKRASHGESGSEH